MRIHWSAKCRCSLTKRPTRWPSATLTLRPTVMAVSATYAYDTASPAPSSKRRPVTLNETRNSENTSAWHASEKKQTNKRDTVRTQSIFFNRTTIAISSSLSMDGFTGRWPLIEKRARSKSDRFSMNDFDSMFFFNENKNKSYIKIPVET